MIYLRFPPSQDEMVQFAEIKKPNYSGVLETALKEWYSDSLAAKYAKILADSLYEVMDFPTYGIYYVNPETQTFFVFSKESNLWVDTKKTAEDYVICPTDKIWDSIFSEHSFLKKVAKLIQSTVENETKILFKADTWADVSSIDLDSGNVYAVGQEEDILKIFKDYFSEKRVNELYLEVKKTLFSTTSNQFVILFEKEILNGMLSAEGYTPFDKSAFSQLEEMFSEKLEENELHKFVSRFKNLMLLRYDYDGYPILKVVKNKFDGKDVYVDYNGLRLLYNNKVYYLPNVSIEVLNAIAEVIRSNFKDNRIQLENSKKCSKNTIKALELNFYCSYNHFAVYLFYRDENRYSRRFAWVGQDDCLDFDFDSLKDKDLRLGQII